jgi:uncharacterized protein (UPF0332 family)
MSTEFLQKAQENLEDTQVALAQGRFNAAANRAYYAGFQAAIAALAAEEIRHPKNPHEWVQAQFSERLIKRKKLYPTKFSSYLLDMQAVRDDADYKVIMTSKKTAKQQVTSSEEFVSFILSKLQSS